MTTVIKNGTIVTADLTYEADVLIEGGRDHRDRAGPEGRRRCWMRPAAMSCPAGSIRIRIWRCRSWAPIRRMISKAARGRRCRAGRRWWWTSCLPGQGQGLMDALQDVAQQVGAGRPATIPIHMAVTWWGEKVWDEMEDVVEGGHHHLQALHGLQGRADGERRRDVRLLPPLRRSGRRCRWSMPRTAMWWPSCRRSCWPRATPAPRRMPIPARPQVEGEATNRAIMIADMAGVPLYVVHTSCEEAHEAIRRARQQGKRVWGEPLIQHLTLDESEYCHPDWDHAARRVMSPAVPRQEASGQPLGGACSRARCRWWRPTIAPSPPSRSASASATSPRSRTAPAGWRTGCRCSGRMGVRHGPADA